MTANVVSVEDRSTGVLMHLDDGSAAVWTPNKEAAVALIGKPIPADWFRKDGDYGPQAFPPRPKGGGGGGGAAWRNTKEGFAAETEGRQRWQQVEEEKKDRRTALMQATEVLKGQVGAGIETALREDNLGMMGASDIVQVAEIFYDWLRETSGAVAAGGTPVGPVGGAVGGHTSAPGLEPAPGPSSSSGDGEVPTATEPGGDSAIGAPLGSPRPGEEVGRGDYPEDWPQEEPR